MNRILTILLAAACVSCSSASDTTAAIDEFAEFCKSPVSARLVASTYSNSLELTCADFRWNAKKDAQ